MKDPCFAAVVRTQGTRPRKLQDALKSLAFQIRPCLAVVVVHAGRHAFEEVERQCRSMSWVQTVALHARDLTRKRGYAINVGFEYLCDVATDVRYAFLLDDEDIVYPFFTLEMLASFVTSGADVVYAASDTKPLHGVGSSLLENFIPTNSYSIRLDTLRERRVWADEQVEELEDARFLIALLDHGFRFQRNSSTLCEVFLGSDGTMIGGKT